MEESEKNITTNVLENVQAVKLYVQFFIKNRQNKLGKHVIAICVIIINICM